MAARTAATITASLALLIILAHAWLIPAGQWQADEYFNFGLFRTQGIDFLLQRIGGWSPRPISEAALYLYGRCVLALHRPLTAPMLALCWLSPLAAVLAAGWRRRPGLDRIMLSLSLYAMFLLNHPINDLFFWPMAAAPYLGCLAAMACVTLLLADRPVWNMRERLVLAGGLIVAVGCAELGIFFALCLCPLLILIEIMEPASTKTHRVQAAAIWSVPLLLGLPLLWIDAHRVATVTDAWQEASPTYRHAGAALLATIRGVPSEILDDGAWSGVVSELLFGVGVFAVLRDRPSPVRQRYVVALAIALIGMILISMLASEYAYGSLCCERHASFRQCLIAILLILAATSASMRWPARRPTSRLAGPILLATALLAGLLPRIADLQHDARIRRTVIKTTHANWTSGLGRNRTGMIFRIAPGGALAHRGLPLIPGTYTTAPGQPWYIQGMLRFFDKQSMTVLAASPGSD